MESPSQNTPSSSASSGQGKSSQTRDTAAKTPGASQTSQGVPSTDNNGQEQISGLNNVSSRQSLEQTRGQIEQLGEHNSQTGATAKANAAPGSQNTPTQPGQSAGRDSATSGKADHRKASEWQKTLQSSLQQGWTSIAQRVKTASPTQLALGAAAVGAAVWLTTRNRKAKASKTSQQSSADRWLDYPTGADSTRSEGRYGQYNRATTPARGQYGSQQSAVAGTQYGSYSQAEKTDKTSATGESQTTKGADTGLHGQSNETWQRPTDERWDD